MKKLIGLLIVTIAFVSCEKYGMNELKFEVECNTDCEVFYYVTDENSETLEIESGNWTKETYSDSKKFIYIKVIPEDITNDTNKVIINLEYDGKLIETDTVNGFISVILPY